MSAAAGAPLHWVMTRSRSPRLILTALAALAGCAPTAPTPFGTAEGGSRTVRGESRSVRFQASCDECLLTWSVGDRSGSLQDRALFSQTVRVTLRTGESREVFMSAAPVKGSVRWVRISVDGTVVAESRGDEGGGAATGGLSARAVLEGRSP